MKQIEPRECAHVIEGLRFALHSIDFSFRHLVKKTHDFEQLSINDTNFDLSFNILNYCWSIVDQSIRAHSLGKSKFLGDLNKDCRRAFLRTTESLRGLRNDFQHLEGRVNGIPELGAPVMGSLCWVSNKEINKCQILILSSGAVMSQYSSLEFDRQEQVFVSDFAFSAFGSQVDLFNLVGSARSFSNELERWLDDRGALLETEVQGSAFTFGPPGLDSEP